MYTKARAYLYKQTLLPNHPYNSLKNTYVSIEKHSTGERFFFLALFEEEAFLTFFFPISHAIIPQIRHARDARAEQRRPARTRFRKAVCFYSFCFRFVFERLDKRRLVFGNEEACKGNSRGRAFLYSLCIDACGREKRRFASRRRERDPDDAREYVAR